MNEKKEKPRLIGSIRRIELKLKLLIIFLDFFKKSMLDFVYLVSF